MRATSARRHASVVARTAGRDRHGPLSQIVGRTEVIRLEGFHTAAEAKDIGLITYADIPPLVMGMLGITYGSVIAWRRKALAGQPGNVPFPERRGTNKDESQERLNGLYSLDEVRQWALDMHQMKGHTLP